MATVRLDEVNLYYEQSGEGEPILLLHGLGSSTRDWELQIEPFAEKYRVTTVDLRGHGRSSKPRGPYSIPMLAGDISAFIQMIGLEPVHIIGISLGGMVSFQLAVTDHDLLNSMVIVNSVPGMILHSFFDHWQLWRRAAIVELMGMRRMGEYLAPRLFPKPEQEPYRQEIAERWAQNDKSAYLAAMRSFVGWDVSDRLASIRCPTLVISADEDYWPISDKEVYAARIPDARLVIIEDSRHATPIDQPARFNSAVLDFLKGLSDHS